MAYHNCQKVGGLSFFVIIIIFRKDFVFNFKAKFASNFATSKKKLLILILNMVNDKVDRPVCHMTKQNQANEKRGRVGCTKMFDIGSRRGGGS